MFDIPSKTRVSSKIAYQNPWITIHEDQTRDRAGNLGVYGYSGVAKLMYGRRCRRA